MEKHVLQLDLGLYLLMEVKYSQEKLFRRLEERLLQPEVRQSAEAVADLLADDFIEFGSSGQVFNKQQIISSWNRKPSV